MMFASPIALLWLIPWAGLAIYLLLGKRESTNVPFIELWRGVSASSKAKREFLLPPRAVMALLLAMLIAIIAASGPKIRKPLSSPHIQVLVDNGVTMSPSGRLPELIRQASPICFNAFPALPQVTLRQAVGDEFIETDASDLPSFADRVTTFPVDTSAAIQSKVARLLQESDDPIVLLSDRRLTIQNPRLFQIAPKTSVENVGLVDIALRDSPRPQIMLRVRNASSQLQSSISIVSGPVRIERPITLPARGKVQNFFFDLPEIASTVKATIEVPDDLPADNVAYLIRTGSNPKLELRGDVGDALQRMVEVYSKNRPASESSQKVIVCDSLFQFPSDSRAVAVVSGASALTQLKSPLQLSMDHPIMQSIDWRSIDRAMVAAAAPGDGWTPLVRSGDLVLLAVRETPVKQVWVGFRSGEFEATRDFVILWTNIFQWLGEGGSSFGYEKIELTGTTPPPTAAGIIQLPDGVNAAMNVLDVQFEENPQSLTRLPSSPSMALGMKGWITLSSWLSLASILLVMLSLLWLRMK